MFRCICICSCDHHDGVCRRYNICIFTLSLCISARERIFMGKFQPFFVFLRLRKYLHHKNVRVFSCSLSFPMCVCDNTEVHVTFIDRGNSLSVSVLPLLFKRTELSMQKMTQKGKKITTHNNGEIESKKNMHANIDAIVIGKAF